MQFEYSQTIRGQAVTGFRPGWWPSIAVALLLPLLLGLGFWQLSRAEEKRALLADFAAREHAEPRREEEPCGDHPRRGHRVGERAEEHRERARGREALRGGRRAREVDAEDHEVRERAEREAPERLGPPGAPEREAQAQKPPHPRARVRPRDARHHERETHGQEERVPVVPRAEDLHAPVGHRAEQRHRQRHEHGQANRCRVARLQGLGAQAREQAAFLARHAATSPRARRPSRQTLMKSSSRSCPGRSASS